MEATKNYKEMTKDEILDYYYSIEPNSHDNICLSEDVLVYMEDVMGITEEEISNHSPK